LSRLLPWTAWLWRRPWRDRMADPDSRGVEVPLAPWLAPWLARHARLVLASCWPCRTVPSRAFSPKPMRQCRPHPPSLSLRMPCAAGTDGGPLGAHTRGWPAAQPAAAFAERLQLCTEFPPSCSDALMRPCCDLRVRVGSVVDAVYDSNVYAGGVLWAAALGVCARSPRPPVPLRSVDRRSTPSPGEPGQTDKIICRFIRGLVSK
jgi:hypothetical protein